jgi:hypothetical protein
MAVAWLVAATPVPAMPTATVEMEIALAATLVVMPVLV